MMSCAGDGDSLERSIRFAVILPFWFDKLVFFNVFVSNLLVSNSFSNRLF